MKRRFEAQPGHEVRGMLIRLYPDAATEAKLEILQSDCRKAWNWMVKQVEEALEANSAFALKQGLVPAKPVRPDYDGLPPEESKAAKKRYLDECREWRHAAFLATKGREECSLRKTSELLAHFGCKFDYQLLTKVIDWTYPEDAVREVKPGAHMLQAVAKNYYQKSNRRKKFRRSDDPMPVQVRSGDCFKVGDFGQRRGKPFYDCEVKINGLRIKGRLPGKAPEGRVLEGVSLIRQADGWWASIKQEVPVKAVPEAVPETVVGIDMGLDYIAAMSDGRRVSNARGKAYAERIAGRQMQKKPVGRLHLAASRHTRHVIYNDILKPLANVETIKVEKLSSKIGQMGSSKTSAMRTVVTLLKQRFGVRVREVDPAYTSQDCSQCGHRSKETWSYEHGRIGECPSCGYREDRDVNAARNIAAKPPIPLES